MSTVAADPIFVGRDAELALLRGKLDEVHAGEPRFVLIEGPPGIGKTALVRRFLAGAPDVRVISGAGAAEEQLLPYGVADQLARSAGIPPSDDLAGLGRRTDRSPEPVTIGAGFLDLLGTLQRSGSVVIVVDDVQWADRPTLLALLFALRRLHADRVLALFTGREEARADIPEGLVRLVDDGRGAVLRLSGLDVGELQALGASLTNRDVPRQLAEHLREHTGGSPLHVRSLLEEVPAERLAQGADAPLPAPQAFSAQVLSRLAASPPDAQRLVVAASILGERCPLALARRLADIDDPLTALEGAMSARLLDEHESGGERHIAFPHALVRSAVYHDLGPARRAALHRRAAELLGDEAASLQHRAAAAPDHDDGLAADLADYARREADRGAWARAAAAMLRASRLTPVGEQREQRLLEAVDCLLAAGNTAEALSFGAEIDGFADGPHKRLVQGRLAWFAGHTSDGEKLLKTAWDLCDATGDRLLSARIALEVATLLIRRARGEELITWSRRALAAASGSRDARAGLGPFAFGAVYAGRAAEGPEEFADLPEAPADFGAGDVFALSGRGYLRLVTDDLRAARADWSAAAATAELWGPLYIRVAALGFLAMTEFRLGAWDDAIMHAELGSVLGDNHAQQHIVTVPHLAAAATLAARGDWAAARAHAEACARVISEEVTTADAAISAALISAAQADHRGVIDALVPFSQLPMDTGVGEPGTRWPWRELSADALVGLGRADEAEAILTPFEQLAARRGRHSAMANAARVRGNLEAARGRIAEADASYIAGFEHAGKVAIPFDVARLEAAYGTFLRRSRRRTEAVSHLTAARERFARLGAGPYLERCERELATCGVARGRSREPDRSKLTTQELSVARLVAAGMSNPRVAAELYVSINTVEFHLKNVYGKLGIRSRSQLAERLAN